MSAHAAVGIPAPSHIVAAARAAAAGRAKVVMGAHGHKLALAGLFDGAIANGTCKVDAGVELLANLLARK